MGEGMFLKFYYVDPSRQTVSSSMIVYKLYSRDGRQYPVMYNVSTGTTWRWKQK